MITTLRRMFWLALLGGAGYAGWQAWRSRSGDEPATAPEWPPLDPPTTTTTTTTIAANVPTADRSVAGIAGVAATPADDDGAPGGGSSESSPTWVLPVDDACPAGYPVKANDNSGIFHVPGGRFYDRTVPERCYADGADAEADGYRRSKA